MSAALEEEIAALPRLGRVGLQSRWCALFKTAPPTAFTPDLLARGIAHCLQEKTLGTLPTAMERQLQANGAGRVAARQTLRPGNRLVRKWRGRTYVVEVTERSLLYDGAAYTSLSEIASKITGTRWSGPRFFGLVK